MGSRPRRALLPDERSAAKALAAKQAVSTSAKSGLGSCAAHDGNAATVAHDFLQLKKGRDICRPRTFSINLLQRRGPSLANSDW